jgi:hypothetical protein
MDRNWGTVSGLSVEQVAALLSQADRCWERFRSEASAGAVVRGACLVPRNRNCGDHWWKSGCYPQFAYRAAYPSTGISLLKLPQKR